MLFGWKFWLNVRFGHGDGRQDSVEDTLRGIHKLPILHYAHVEIAYDYLLVYIIKCNIRKYVFYFKILFMLLIALANEG